MRRRVLPKDVVIPNPQPGGRPVIFHVLRRLPDHAAGKEAVVRPDRRLPRQVDMRADDAVRADLHALIDDGVRSDPDRGVQLRFGMNYCGRMNHQGQKWGNCPSCQAKSARVCHYDLELQAPARVVFAQEPLDEEAHLGPHALPHLPVHRSALAQPLGQLSGELLQGGVAHLPQHLQPLGQGIVEGDLVLVQVRMALR